MLHSTNSISVYVPLMDSPRSDSSFNSNEEIQIEEQKLLVAEERWRQHIRWCDRMSESQRLSFQNRRISLKILMSEAYKRDISTSTTSGDSKEERKQKWQDIAARAMQDMEHQDNSAVVLKNLSCMCVFIDESICRDYGENNEARERRIENMRSTIRTLQENGALFAQEETPK